MDTIDKTLYAIRCRISEVSSGTQEHSFLTNLAREITLNTLKEAEVKNLAQPDVSGQFCGTCETELQLWNVKFKQWYCPQCRSYLPQHFR